MLCGPIRQTLSDKPYQTNSIRRTLPDKPYQTLSDRPVRQTLPLPRHAVPCQEKGLVATVYSLTFYFSVRGDKPLVCVFAWCGYVCACVWCACVCVEALITRRVQSSGLE